MRLITDSYNIPMNILFLEIDQEREWAVASIGPAFIGAFLRAHGHGVELLRVSLSMDADELAARIRAAAPGLLGVSLTTRQWLRAREIVAAIRARLDVPLIAGGLHPTFSPELVLASPGFDYVCLGEGEQAMLELVQHLERSGGTPPEGIRNIWPKGGERPAVREPFAPLEDLPFLARDLLDEKYGVVHIVTQRGCPFPCTYCAARQLSDLYDGAYATYGRRRSPENVFAELEQIRRDGLLSYVIFLDDTFTIDHRWVKRFCALYGPRLGVPFSLHARVETVNPAMLRELAAAGCRHIVYGVESGSERVRREIMQRHAGNQRFIDVFRWTREAGMLVTANYIIGTPGETGEDIEQTLALHDALAPDDFGYFVFYPYPGTSLFHLCRERGYLPEDYYEQPANHRQTILTLPDLSPEDIEHYYERFTRVRERDQLARLGPDQSQYHQSVVDEVRASAALG